MGMPAERKGAILLRGPRRCVQVREGGKAGEKPGLRMAKPVIASHSAGQKDGHS